MLDSVWPRMAVDAHATATLKAGGRRLMLTGVASMLVALCVLLRESLVAVALLTLPALNSVALALLELHLWVAEPRHSLFILAASVVAVLTVHVRNTAMMTGLVMTKGQAQSSPLSAEELVAAVGLHRANLRASQFVAVGIVGGSVLLAILAIPGRLVLDMPPSDAATVVGIAAVTAACLSLVSPVFSWLLPLNASLRLDLECASGGVSGNLRYSVWSADYWSLADRAALLLNLLADRAGQTKELRHLIGELDA